MADTSNNKQPINLQAGLSIGPSGEELPDISYPTWMAHYMNAGVPPAVLTYEYLTLLIELVDGAINPEHHPIDRFDSYYDHSKAKLEGMSLENFRNKQHETVLDFIKKFNSGAVARVLYPDMSFWLYFGTNPWFSNRVNTGYIDDAYSGSATFNRANNIWLTRDSSGQLESDGIWDAEFKP
jgi:hypothetical protein